MLKIRKINFFVALIFEKYVKFLNLLIFNFFDLNKSTTILLALLLPSTILLILGLSNFDINSPKDQVIFSIKVSDVKILLKS